MSIYLILICLLISIVGEIGYVIMLPFGALLFKYGRRNPLGGIIASFAGILGYKISLFLASIVAIIAFAFTLRLKSRDEQIATMKANQ